jgi:hypothetical protein
MKKPWAIQNVSNTRNSGNLYPKGMKAYKQNSSSAGSLARKYNHCRNNNVGDVLECVLNPSCCPKAKKEVIYSVVGGRYTTISSGNQGFIYNINDVSALIVSLPPGYDPTDHQYAYLTSISASSNGNAVAGGSYRDDTGAQQAFVTNQVNGQWKNPSIKVPLPIGYDTTDQQNAATISVSSTFGSRITKADIFAYYD